MLKAEQPSPVDYTSLWLTNDCKNRLSLRSDHHVPAGPLCAAGVPWAGDDPVVCETSSFFPARAAGVNRLSGRHVLGHEHRSGGGLCSA